MGWTGKLENCRNYKSTIINTFIDQMGRKVILNSPPKRIISLVPSQTELLYDLGLTENVVGITKFCVHPESWRKQKQIVGGTKNVHLDKIRDLSPDLIIGNKEENSKEDIDRISKNYPVWMSDIYTYQDVIDMISSVGELTNTSSRATRLIEEINNEFEDLVNFEGKKAAYFIWKNPYMVAGSETFIHDMINKLGLQNVFENKKRYSEVNLQELISLNLDLILLSSEPFPFKLEDCKQFRNLLTNTNVKLVDGEMFSWYGSRLKHAPKYFRELYNEIIN